MKYLNKRKINKKICFLGIFSFQTGFKTVLFRLIPFTR